MRRRRAGDSVEASIRLLAKCSPADVPARIKAMQSAGVNPRSVAAVLDKHAHPVPLPTWTAFLECLDPPAPAADPPAPVKPFTRLDAEQRDKMRAAFHALPAERVYGWAYIYMSRELRFRSRYRDWIGISELLEWATARGVLEKVETAIERVEQEIRGHYPAIEEVYTVPEWERHAKQRKGFRRWENCHAENRFPNAWWAR